MEETGDGDEIGEPVGHGVLWLEGIQLRAAS